MFHWQSEQLEAFRRDVAAFCAAELPEPSRRKVQAGTRLEKHDIVDWERRLAARGWLVGHWPVAEGGQGWGALQRFVFLDETSAAGAPRVSPFGVNYVGPVIYTFGTAEQRRRYLPDIAAARACWCQGYSEPSAGSDLAALTTRATRDGDHYRVTGQKVWTTAAHWADMMFCLVRTAHGGRPQDGISFLLIDMNSPRVTVRPIITLDGCHETNEVFLDDVKVPVDNLVGEENKGWAYAKFLLDNERVSISHYVGKIRMMLGRLRSLAEQTLEGGRPRSEDPIFQRRFAELDLDARVLQALCGRLVLEIEQGRAGAGVGPAMLKLRCTELSQSIAQAQVDLLQSGGLPYSLEQLDYSGLDTPDDGVWASGLIRAHLIGRASTIYGGSSEIQRNVIAKGLGL